MFGKRLQDFQVVLRCCPLSACDGRWNLIGLAARAVQWMGGRSKAVIGPTTCKTKELQHGEHHYNHDNHCILNNHNYYDVREASSGFSGCVALLFVVSLRWPAKSNWTRGKCRLFTQSQCAVLRICIHVEARSRRVMLGWSD